MYPIYSTEQATLTDDDVAGLCFLYGADTACTCPAGFLCGDDGCREVCAAIACAVGSTCLDSSCVAPPECETDAECEAERRCVDGFCTHAAAGTGPNGFPCERGSDCETGVCTPASVCGCRDDGCALASVFGETCGTGRDCESSICLVESSTAYCTERCDSRACPAGFACTGVDGHQVCRASASGGCSAAAATGRRAWGTTWAGMIAFVAGIVLGRRGIRKEHGK